MRVLGIETSCDETSAGIVDDRGQLLANVVASQVDLHSRYGGIVPEIASRQHVIDIVPVIQQAMTAAGLSWRDIPYRRDRDRNPLGACVNRHDTACGGLLHRPQCWHRPRPADSGGKYECRNGEHPPHDE